MYFGLLKGREVRRRARASTHLAKIGPKFSSYLKSIRDDILDMEEKVRMGGMFA